MDISLRDLIADDAKSSVTVRLMGGMGNQMFQYAYAVSLPVSEVRIDTGMLGDFDVKRVLCLDLFNAKYTPANINRTVARLRKALGLGYTYNPAPYTFDKSNLSVKSGIVHGYFQSYKYFSPDIVRRHFTAKNVPAAIKQLCMSISAEKNTVCVNVRRADFVDSPYHMCLDADYFYKAAQIMESKIGPCKFFVFSDDIEWCINNINLPGAQFITHDYAGDRFLWYFELMRSCRHFIIPNSTFGWWAAWLGGEYDKVVICPEKWYIKQTEKLTDLIPQNWITI